jgi:hypothetical protein
MELRLTDANYALVGVDIGQREAQQFSAAQSCRVEQNHGEPHDGRAER